MIDVNLWGVIHGVHSFLPLLTEHGEGGHIVNTSSMAALCIVPHLAAYSVTKFGVAALTETLRIESELYGYGVGTSLLCPGPVRTNIGRSSRNRPNNLTDGALGDFELEDTNHFDGPVPWLSGEDVGEMVVQAIKTNAPYVITHPEFADPVIARHAAIEAAMQSPRPGGLSR
ncbi:putative oxidoreductase (plasmid) [Sphingobium sp. EP60837]|nr:putative oxidoreductase [Sphingobium sp. EP60837]